MHRRSLLALLRGACLAPSLTVTSIPTLARMRKRVIDGESITEQIGGRDVVSVALNGEMDEFFAHDLSRVDECHPPSSSFKIPNLLIALETDIASSLDHQVQ